MALSNRTRELSAEVREELRRQRLERRFQLAISQACRALRALSDAPNAPPAARYMAAVYEHHLKQFSKYESNGHRWLVEVSPHAIQSSEYYRIRFEDDRLDIECQGTDGTEARCRVAIVGDRAEILVEEASKPAAGLAVLPSKSRVSLLAKMTSEAISWCESDRFDVKVTDLNAQPTGPTSWTIEAST